MENGNESKVIETEEIKEERANARLLTDDDVNAIVAKANEEQKRKLDELTTTEKKKSRIKTALIAGGASVVTFITGLFIGHMATKNNVTEEETEDTTEDETPETPEEETQE